MESKCLNQNAFIRQYNDEHREEFNPLFFYRSDDEIIQELQKVILSCQRDKHFLIQVESFEVKEGYEEILEELRLDEMNRNPKDKDNKYNYISLKESKIKLLIVNYFIRIYDGKPENPENSKRLRVLIEVPRIVDKYYFQIFGNIYSSTFQVVDGSTYNNTSSNSKTQSVSLKTMFMAVRLYRYKKYIDTVNYGTIPCVFFLSRIFDKPVLILYYLLAQFGLYKTCEALKVYDFRVSESYDPEAEKDRYVVKKQNLYLSLPKFIYENDQVAQSLLYTVVMGITKESDINNIFTRDHWVRVLGGSFGARTEKKGYSILDSLESIYDLATQSAIRLPYEDKKDIYSVLIWAIREFSALRQKDIFDIAFKRLRFPEYIAALYALKLAKGIRRIADSGNSLSVDQIVKSINIYPDYLLKQITSDKLVNYKNLVSDADALYALKFTYKGVSGIGEDNNNKGSSVPPAFRRVHPSHLGRVDLDTSSATDPGLSGMLCPLADIYNNSFSDYEEPNTWREKSDELLREYRQLMGFKEAIDFKRELGFPVDNSRAALVSETMDIIRDLLSPVTVIENELVRGVLYL